MNGHLSGASSYLKVCEYYNCPRVLFTATPARLDGKSLTLADKLIIGIEAEELIKQGNIAPYDYYAPKIDYDVSKIDRVAGDFNVGEMAKELDKGTIYGDIIKYYRTLGENRQAIAYCANVNHSQKVAETFNNNGIKAIHMDATTSAKEREKILEDFKNNKFKVLCNCNLISEGITLPTASVGLLLRSTLSVPLFIQQACRVLTPNKGKKAVIIDFVGNCFIHGMPTEKREWNLDKPAKARNPSGENGIIIRQCPNCYKTYQPTTRICPYCKYEAPKTEREIKVEEKAELEKIQKIEKFKRKKEIYDCKTYPQLIQYAKEHGYKNPGGWAYYILNSRKNKNKK